MEPPHAPAGRPTGAWRRGWWLLALAVEAALLVNLSRHGDFRIPGEAARFAAWGLAAGAAYGLAAFGFVHGGSKIRGTRRRRGGTLILWGATIGLRLLVLPTFPSDDLWRYRWEGKVQLHGFNPYLVSPDAPALAHLRDEDWSRLNHQHHAAVYPPLAQRLFAGLAAVHTPVLAYKLCFLLADLGVIFLLRRREWTATRDNDDDGEPRAAAWYAWNPLVVYAGAGAAHFDALMVLAMVAAVWTLDRSLRGQPAGVGGGFLAPPLAWISALLLGVAVAIKLVPIVLVPVWWFALGWRRALPLLPVAVLPWLGLAVVFYGFPAEPILAPMQNFARTFRVNDPVWWLLGTSGALDNAWPQRVTVLVCVALAWGFRRDWRRGALWVLGAAVVLSPVVHAWYLVWVLPLAAGRARTAWPWFVWSVSVFGYFLLWEVNRRPGPWEQPVWLRLLILLPPGLAWAWVAVRTRRPGGSDSPGRLQAEAE